MRELSEERYAHRNNSRLWAEKKQRLNSEVQRHKVESIVMSDMLHHDMTHAVAGMLNLRHLQWWQNVTGRFSFPLV